jgi:hypothetical protein
MSELILLFEIGNIFMLNACRLWVEHITPTILFVIRVNNLSGPAVSMKRTENQRARNVIKICFALAVHIVINRLLIDV